MRENPQIIYDAGCRLCNRAVSFLKAGVQVPGTAFFPSGSPDSETLLKEHQIPGELTEKTVILLENRKIFIKSSAIIKAIQNKGGFWRLAGLLKIIPLFVRDAVYDYLANNRKKPASRAI